MSIGTGQIRPSMRCRTPSAGPIYAVGVSAAATRSEQAGNNQGQRQIAAALRRAARQHSVERNVARSAERGEHVAVRQRADDFHRFGGGQQFGAAQTRRAVAQCARRASATGWRGSGFWSCRLRGNSPAAGMWPLSPTEAPRRPSNFGAVGEDHPSRRDIAFAGLCCASSQQRPSR
jgi:hypothetical protein